MALKKQKKSIDAEEDSQSAMNKALNYAVAEEIFMSGQLRTYMQVG